MRWTARVTSAVVIATLLLFLIGERGAERSSRPNRQEFIGLLFFPTGVVVGLMLAWWREGLGAAIALGSLAAFSADHMFLRGGIPGGSGKRSADTDVGPTAMQLGLVL